MVAGVIILIVIILMVIFLAKRVRSAQQMFDDIQVGEPEENKEASADEEPKS